jgi:hypothetical protein
VAKKPTAKLPLTAAELRALKGRYHDRCGTEYLIAERPTHGFGLYRADLPDDARPHQTDAYELRRLIGYGSFTRLR